MTILLIVVAVLLAIAALVAAWVWLICSGRGAPRDVARPALIAAVVLLVLAIAAAWGAALAQSGHHGDGHAQAHDIYKRWTPPGNPSGSCCNALSPDNPTGDCRPTQAYLHDDGLWRAWNGYLWLAVPPEKVLPTDHAGDGRSHLCEKGTHIYCFTPAQPKS